MPRRSPRREYARHSAAGGCRLPACGSRLMRRLAAKLSNDERGALLAEIARNRGRQLLDRDGGAPQPEARRHRRALGRHEQVRLQPFDRGRRARERGGHVGEDVERQAPQHAVHQRRQVEPEQVLRAQPRDAERAERQDVLADQIGVREARQQQRVGPYQNADGHAGERAARGAVAPDQPAEERRVRAVRRPRRRAGRSPQAGPRRPRR